MRYEQKIYYAIAGFAIFLGWLVAAAIIIKHFASGIALNGFQHFVVKAYVYGVNWKVYAFVCLIFGVKAAILSDKKDLAIIIIESLSYILLAVAYSLFNAITLAFLPIAIAYLALYFYRDKNPLLIGLSVLFFALATTFFSLFVHDNSFLLSSFSDLTQTRISLANLNKIFAMLFKPQQLFGLSFGFTLLFLGYWIGKAKWFLEYHFLYHELKKLFKLSIGLLIIWIGLNYFSVYDYITQWKIGKLFFILDGFAVQLITLFVYVFALIYLENFRWGLKVLKLLEQAGRGWFYQMGVLFAFLLLVTFDNLTIQAGYILLTALGLFFSLALLVKSSPTINIE